MATAKKTSSAGKKNKNNPLAKYAFAILAIIVVIVLLGILKSQQENFPEFGESAPSYSKGYNYDTISADDSYLIQEERSATPPQSPDRQVIQSASLTLVVNNTEDTASQISSLTQRESGYVENLNIYETDANEKIGQITIRIPKDSLSSIVNVIKKMAVKVENEQISSNDITETYIDIEARLNNLTATEARFLDLLDQADKVEEILQVEKELNSTRENIERLKAQLDNLTNQVELATISITLKSEADVKIFGITWSPLNQIKLGVQSLLEGLIGFANSLIRLVFWLPIIALWLGIIALVIWIGRKGYLLTTKKKTK